MRNLLSKIFIISLFFLLFSADVFSQETDLQNDLKAISSSVKKDKQKRKPYIYKNEKSVIKKYNPVSLTFGGLLYFYQNAITYQFSAGCIYNPTCSEFSKQCIREYGLFKGVLLSADRLSRCSRIVAPEIHPLKIDRKTHRANDKMEFYK